MRESIDIKRGNFLFLAFFYFLASFFGFAFSSGGWTLLFYLVPSLIFFLVNYLFLCSFINIKRPDYLNIPMKWFSILILIQIFAYLSALGDYGDNSGSRSFFEVFLGRSADDCHRPPMLGYDAMWLAIAGAFSYLVALITFQVKILRKGTSK